MSEMQAKRECDFCGDECTGILRYSIGFNVWDGEEHLDIFQKEVCYGCYVMVQQGIVELLRKEFRRRLGELEELYPLPVEV